MLYRSTGLSGQPIAVSGVVIVPAGPVPPGGRPIVAWAHPTSGVVSRCAPSLATFLFEQIQGLRRMVEHGYIVAATDYPGLGTPGPHPYLVGVSEARAVLDSVRAARAVAGAAASDRFAVWGHSQGGQAALFTGLIARAYAPELKLAGIAAAAPATDLRILQADDIDSDGGRNLTAMTLWSWSQIYGAPLAPVVLPGAERAVDALSHECIESVYDLLACHFSQRPLRRQFLKVKDLGAVEPWRGLLRENTPGPLPPEEPVFLAQGTADQLVRPPVTRRYARELCGRGSRVRYLSLPGIGHGRAAMRSADAAVAWMAGRFAGAAAPSDCGVLR
ncbi:MAG TPA: lipase family protein [Hyphomicrobiales bacterium]|nr:lipase family protein [Hyphomicrobiales bacterium]